MNELAEKSALLKQDIENINKSKTELESTLSGLRKTERDKLSERENISGELARLQERRANLQKQYDEITAKLWEEYELTKREAENIAVKIEEVGKAQRRLNELKQKIRSLGNVNVSAIDEYKEMDRSSLYVAEVYANQGPTLKRYWARSHGRADMIKKHTSHITIVLDQK